MNQQEFEDAVGAVMLMCRHRRDDTRWDEPMRELGIEVKDEPPVFAILLNGQTGKFEFFKGTPRVGKPKGVCRECYDRIFCEGSREYLLNSVNPETKGLDFIRRVFAIPLEGLNWESFNVLDVLNR